MSERQGITRIPSPKALCFLSTIEGLEPDKQITQLRVTAIYKYPFFTDPCLPVFAAFKIWNYDAVVFELDLQFPQK